MVLTRAQAADQAAVLATIQDSEPVTAIVELSDESRVSAMPVTSASSDQLAYLAQLFMGQTHVLAAEQALLTAQIEPFVNKKFAEALREVQQKSHESQLMILSQNDGVRAQFEEAETKISSILDGIPTRIHRAVEDKLNDSMHPGEETSKLLEKMVQSSCANAELLRSLEGMQHEIARSVEEFTRDWRPVFNVLTNTQAELHLQVQRQADATSILQERLQRHTHSSTAGERLVDEAAIKDLVKEVLHREVELASECKREPQQMKNTEEDHVSFSAQGLFRSFERQARQYADEMSLKMIAMTK
ncbi:hypothetical protein ON010_g15035 [Phytophthora cinnamomi]|nr:hypothetical protein ON010_g15035 [Phytophthora cinnamomi]